MTRKAFSRSVTFDVFSACKIGSKVGKPDRFSRPALHPLYTSLAILVLILYGLLEAVWLPWKVPMINLADMFVNASLILLVTKSIQTDVDMETQFADTLSVCLLVFLGCKCCFGMRFCPEVLAHPCSLMCC